MVASKEKSVAVVTKTCRRRWLTLFRRSFKRILPEKKVCGELMMKSDVRNCQNALCLTSQKEDGRRSWTKFFFHRL